MMLDELALLGRYGTKNMQERIFDQSNTLIMAEDSRNLKATIFKEHIERQGAMLCDENVLQIVVGSTRH